jgi:5-methylcytosine-specific restriction endonuclease McrA
MEEQTVELETAQKQWEIAVITRDKNLCVICGYTVKVDAYHIIPKVLEYDTDNGITLCKHCFKDKELLKHWIYVNNKEQYLSLVNKVKAYISSISDESN